MSTLHPLNPSWSEEEKYHERKMQAIGSVVGKIAHDLNNHLTVITGFSELAMMDLQSLGRPTGSIDQVLQAAEQIAALARRFQVYSRRSMSRTGLADLRQILRRSESDFRNTLPKGLELQLDLPPETAWVAADPEAIEEVLKILVVNACEAMPTGGPLRIRTAGSQPEGSTHLVLTVSDSGTGMSAAAKEHLFEPFFTTKEGHKGFGLFTAYGLIRKAKGSIRIASQEGEGTTVQVCFPQAAGPQS
jgi:two-component system, cell cycle sensor histidine kinase and response regulator CckA